MATQEENFRLFLVIIAIIIMASIVKCKGAVRSGAAASSFLLVRPGCGYCTKAKSYIKTKGLNVPMKDATSADYQKYNVRGVPALILSDGEKVVGWGEEMQVALDKFK